MDNDQGNDPGPRDRLRKQAALAVGLLVIGVLFGVGLGRFGAPRYAVTPIPFVSEAHQAPTQDQGKAVAPEPVSSPAPAAEPLAERAPEPPAAGAPEPVPAPVPPQVSPKPDANGPWRRHARAAPNTGQAPVIALIIDDVGLDRRGLQRAIDLPGAVTLSILPYAPDAAKVAARARAAGHEIMIHLPMEPIGDENPGPDAIRVGMAPEALSANLEKAFSAFEGYVGLNNHMGSKATQDPAVMTALMAEIAARNMLFIDSRTTGRSVGLEAAARAGVPAAARDIFIDDDPQATAIERQMNATEVYARRHGAVIAIAHPRAGSLDLLERWLAEVQMRGCVLVPVSEVVRRRLIAAQAG